jgi:competence protein ComEC
LPIAVLGVRFLCLWKGRLRWLGLPFALAVLMWPRAPAPDLWIGDGGTNAAFRGEHAAVVVRPGVRQFAVDLWSRRRGLEAVERPAEGWTCTRFACAPSRRDGAPIAIWWGRRAPNAAQMTALCASAPVVSVRAVVPSLPTACDGRLVLDGLDYARGGAVELWRDGSGWRAAWTTQARGDRPWSRLGDPDFSDSGG